MNECKKKPGDDLLSHSLICSTIGAAGLNGRVRKGNECTPCAIITRKIFGKSKFFRKGKTEGEVREQRSNDEKRNSQTNRTISTGKLNTLLCLHTRPINLVVFKESYPRTITRWDTSSWEELRA